MVEEFKPEIGSANGESDSEGNGETNATVIRTESANTNSETVGSGSKGRNARRNPRIVTSPTAETEADAESSDSVKPLDFSQFSVTQDKPKQERQPRATNNDAVQLTSVFMIMLNGLVINMIGNYAAFTKQESDLIASGITNLLKNSSKSTLRKIGKFTDPMALIMGFGMWAIRVQNMHKQMKEAEERAQAAPANFSTVTEPISNGHLYPEDEMMLTLQQNMTDV